MANLMRTKRASFPKPRKSTGLGAADIADSV